MNTTLLCTPFLESAARGSHGDAARKAVALLSGLAHSYDARRLIPVDSVQISGVSIWNLGPAGLEFLETMAQDGVVRVPTTLNPAGFNPEIPAPHVPHETAAGQRRVIEAYTKMGVSPTLTCAPYLYGNLPLPGQHLAWSESSAVVFSNSVLGARTNREGGPSALAAALTGYTPEYGLHLTENRAPEITVRLQYLPRSPLEWGLTGALLGKTSPKIPLILLPEGAPHPGIEALQALSAAIVTYGGPFMFHIQGVTPEWGNFPVPLVQKELTRDDLTALRAELSAPEKSHADLVFLGCPHYGPLQLEGLSCDGRLQVGCGAQADTKSPLRGGCAAVAPLPAHVKRIATNSAKACFYLRNRGVEVILAEKARCIELARQETP